MVIMKIKGLLAVGFAAALLTGCANDKVDENENQAEAVKPVTTQIQVAPDPQKVVRQDPSITGSGEIEYYKLGDDEGVVLKGVFLFDFDQAIVKRNGHTELDQHARILKEDRSLTVRLEGHADERGTREYNLALGERRAMSVRAYLVNQGVSGRQLETVSYGEEKPAVRGNTEAARAQNRRVVFKYSK